MLIHNQRLSNDFCDSPSLRQLHGQLAHGLPQGPQLKPLFHQSKLDHNPHMLLTPLENYQNATTQGTNDQFLPWDEKVINKIFWRGKMTGDIHQAREDYNWRNSHRIRLHRMSHETKGMVGIYVKGKETGKWDWQSLDKTTANEVYMDVGLTDGPIQVGSARSTAVCPVPLAPSHRQLSYSVSTVVRADNLVFSATRRTEHVIFSRRRSNFHRASNLKPRLNTNVCLATINHIDQYKRTG